MAETTNITSTQVSGVYDQWGITVNEYNMISGTSTYKNMDLQDLVTRVGTKRAASIEREISALSVKMKQRNTELDNLSSVLSVMGSLNSQYSEDDKGAKTYTYDSKFLEGCKAASEGNWYTYSYSVLLLEYNYLVCTISGTNFQFVVSQYNKQTGTTTTNTSSTMNKANCELLLQTAKTKVDSLNNASQSDMTKLQSYVSKRDEAYSTATSLSTSVAETRSNLIKNI